MGLTPEDLEVIGNFIDKKIQTVVKTKTDAVDEPDSVKAEEWYVHLADGRVVTLPADEVSTAFDGVAVIGKYRVGD